MPDTADEPGHGTPWLLTPGPLSTSRRTRQAMLRDLGSWDSDFRELTARIRRQLLELAGPGHEVMDCVPVQGSGTFAVEAMLACFLPRDGRALVLVNGAYGGRIVRILERLGRAFCVIDKGDRLPPQEEEVTAALAADPDITHVVVVHCETSSGILNPVAEIAAATRRAGRRLLVDAMSAFGALPLDIRETGYEALVSSPNKCIEGVPGFGFVIGRRDSLAGAAGRAHSLSLDLYDQWVHMNRTGQWRYTPPTHAVAAFAEALEQHREEGGTAGRGARYHGNMTRLVQGMRALGFETLLQDRWLSPVIVTFLSPDDPAFHFEHFYEVMKRRNFIIYPGKLTEAETFRIGCIGCLDAGVMDDVVRAAGQALQEMGVRNVRGRAPAGTTGTGEPQ